MMSRPLRIEYKDAWYHVMNRGRRGDSVFLEEADYINFKTLLKESSGLWKVHVCAYCLMPNHYHLLIQTPQANLSRFMRHLNGIYTQRFNRFHQLDGQLFRGRYKSILIGEPDYLLELLRYIHFNPVKAGLVKKPDEYIWSSYSSYVLKRKQDDWLNSNLVFDQIRGKRKTKKEKVNCLQKDASDDIYEFFGRKNLLSILGSKEFVTQIRNKFFRSMVHPEIPDVRQLALEAKTIIRAVSGYFKIPQKKLYIHQRAKENIPRDIAMYLIRAETGKTLVDIGKLFQMEKYSSVSNCISRIKKRRLEDKQLSSMIKEIESAL